MRKPEHNCPALHCDSLREALAHGMRDQNEIHHIPVPIFINKEICTMDNHFETQLVTKEAKHWSLETQLKAVEAKQ